MASMKRKKGAGKRLAPLDLDGTETGSLTSFLTKPRGLLVGRGEGDGGAKGGLHGARSMRNLRGGANVLNPRRGKLLEDLKQRSFMFSQSHKPDAREVRERMREEWVSVLSPNGLAQEVQIWSELDRFRAPTTSRGHVLLYFSGRFRNTHPDPWNNSCD